MTPKDKAVELVYEYYFFLKEVKNTITIKECKNCASVAVDEILSMGIMSDSGDWEMAKLYWEEVKKEIENL